MVQTQLHVLAHLGMTSSTTGVNGWTEMRLVEHSHLWFKRGDGILGQRLFKVHSNMKMYTAKKAEYIIMILWVSPSYCRD